MSPRAARVSASNVLTPLTCEGVLPMAATKSPKPVAASPVDNVTAANAGGA